MLLSNDLICSGSHNLSIWYYYREYNKAYYKWGRGIGKSRIHITSLGKPRIINKWKNRPGFQWKDHHLDRVQVSMYYRVTTHSEFIGDCTTLLAAGFRQRSVCLSSEKNINHATSASRQSRMHASVLGRRCSSWAAHVFRRLHFGDVKHHKSSSNESLRGSCWRRVESGFTTENHNNFLSCCIIKGFCNGCVPPVMEDEMPLEVLRGAPFVAYQAKQIEMSGGVRVVVALRVLHQVLPLVRGLLTRFTDMH